MAVTAAKGGFACKSKLQMLVPCPRRLPVREFINACKWFRKLPNGPSFRVTPRSEWCVRCACEVRRDGSLNGMQSSSKSRGGGSMTIELTPKQQTLLYLGPDRQEEFDGERDMGTVVSLRSLSMERFSGDGLRGK